MSGGVSEAESPSMTEPQIKDAQGIAQGISFGLLASASSIEAQLRKSK
jgi:hypothetical protein